jgi:hypothetical protein
MQYGAPRTRSTAAPTRCWPARSRRCESPSTTDLSRCPTDRIKPAYIMVETDDRTVTTRAPPEQTTQPALQPKPPATQTCRSSRGVRFRHGSTSKHHSPQGGDVGTPHNANSGPFIGPSLTPTRVYLRPFSGPRSAAVIGQSDQLQANLF